MQVSSSSDQLAKRHGCVHQAGDLTLTSLHALHSHAAACLLFRLLFYFVHQDIQSMRFTSDKELVLHESSSCYESNSSSLASATTLCLLSSGATGC